MPSLAKLCENGRKNTCVNVRWCALAAGRCRAAVKMNDIIFSMCFLLRETEEKTECPGIPTNKRTAHKNRSHNDVVYKETMMHCDRWGEVEMIFCCDMIQHDMHAPEPHELAVHVTNGAIFFQQIQGINELLIEMKRQERWTWFIATSQHNSKHSAKCAKYFQCDQSELSERWGNACVLFAIRIDYWNECVPTSTARQYREY